MISGPVVVQVLEGEDAIAKNREIMGATILLMRMTEPFVRILQRALRQTLCMARTRRKRPFKRYLTFLAPSILLADLSPRG